MAELLRATNSASLRRSRFIKLTYELHYIMPMDLGTPVVFYRWSARIPPVERECGNSTHFSEAEGVLPSYPVFDGWIEHPPAVRVEVIGISSGNEPRGQQTCQ